MWLRPVYNDDSEEQKTGRDACTIKVAMSTGIEHRHGKSKQKRRKKEF